MATSRHGASFRPHIATPHRIAPPVILWLLAAGAATGQTPPQTLPAGGAFTAGSGAIATAGNTLTITQTTPRAIITWPGFSTGPGSTVTFANGTGATLNRVTGASPSTLAGNLTATGSVYLINQNGIVIGPGGRVVTGGTFAASTRDVPDAGFMAGGTLAFTGTSPGAVTNAGSITSQSGNVILIGAAAANHGTIAAPAGTAALAAANQVILAPAAGPSGLYVAPDTAATGSVTNTGAIRAAAAALTAAGGNVYALAGNQSGLIQATGAADIGGQVWLTAPNGNVTAAAAIRAIAPAGTGGTIIADGRTVTLTATAALDATGLPGKGGGTILAGVTAPGGINEARHTTIATGATLKAGPGGEAAINNPGGGAAINNPRYKAVLDNPGRIETSGLALTLGAAAISAGPGGLWLLDPANLTIDAPAAATIDSALNAGTDVTQQTTGAPGPGTGDITLAAPLTWSSSATLTLSAFENLDIAAPIAITGNGGLALTTANNTGGQSAPAMLSFQGGGAITYTAGADSNAAPLTIDGTRYSLIFTPAQLQATGATGRYALAQNLNLAGIAFTPLAPKTFTGDFNGLGNTIANLTITDTTGNQIGLFAAIGLTGSVENLGLVGGAVTGGGGLFNSDGALAGTNAGTLRNDFATSAVAAADPQSIGGLVGTNAGTIAQSYATGAVTATGAGTENVGGLVGATEPGGLLQDDYATGAVTGAPFSLTGGLAGLNFETIIEDAYATGAVTGGNTAGLVANDQAGSYLDAYYDSTTTGSTAGPGMALTTADWFSDGPLAPGSPNGFINPVWRQGAPYPVLSSLPYVTVAETGAQTYGGKLAAAVLSITTPSGQNAAGQVDTAHFGVLTAANTTTDIGTYSLGGTGDTDPGVQIDYTGQLTITPATLTIIADNLSATYGATQALGLQDITAAGLLNNDQISAISFATAAGPASPVGAYTITPAAAAGPGLANYLITYRPGTLTIDPAPLVITADNLLSTYGQTPSLTGQFTTAGLLNDDSVQSLTLTAAATAASPAGATYTLTPAGAAGPGLANYIITYAPGTITIAPAPLIITADPQAKQAAQALALGDTAFTVTGLVNGDTVETVTLTSPGALADALLTGMPYAIIPSNAAGTGLSNYTITYRPGPLTITRLAIAPPAAAALPDGNNLPTTLLLATGPAGNNPLALPQFLSPADTAGLTQTSTGLLISTGLPLTGPADTLPLLTERSRHLTLRLPPAMPRAPITPF